jgi:Uma2 family endonuclease
MEAAVKIGLLAAEEYLSGERNSEVRHEYIGGVAYAMAGASEEHNLISLNLATVLRAQVRTKSWRVFMVDMKVRLSVGREDVFYYSDVVVACDGRDTDRYFKRYPTTLIEVLSEETERTDRREKFLSYTGIETLQEYLLVAQDRMEVTIFRRRKEWQPKVLTKKGQIIRLESIAGEIPLSAVYQGVKV